MGACQWAATLGRGSARLTQTGPAGRSTRQMSEDTPPASGVKCAVAAGGSSSRRRSAAASAASAGSEKASTMPAAPQAARRSEEHTSELQSLMRISYAVFCLKKKNKHHNKNANKMK